MRLQSGDQAGKTSRPGQGASVRVRLAAKGYEDQPSERMYAHT